ncbi:hypothetical protein [Kordia zhangzhouensis]|uniref:hypothetical protein n=1 Tax=Kordia zhangzhouensis TaxID=1620405 RepID=UPI000629AA1D|nr:hypothetical protein [Kordia zhangzhouensis]
MNPQRKLFFYKKQLNGRGCFGGVDLELNKVNEKSKVIDKCEWRDWKAYNVDFQETAYMKSIKVYILNSIEYILENYAHGIGLEISLTDIKVLPSDTQPTHILASVIIGTYRLISQHLNENQIALIDKFIIQNTDNEFPNYNKLILEILKNN